MDGPASDAEGAPLAATRAAVRKALGVAPTEQMTGEAEPSAPAPDSTPTLDGERDAMGAELSDAPAIPEVGSQVGPYQLRHELGRGGSGVVMLARHTSIGRSVALKLFLGRHHASRFLCEARTIARLDHPNIVKLWDFGESSAGLYLALEYVEGDTLHERLRAGPLATDESLRILRAIAEALEHAHASGVVHCDLKPSNVMIGRDGRVRVVDFGIAQSGDDLPRGGTPEWMAPEQWEPGARGPLTDRVDSWALGVIACQLCSGEHPAGAAPKERLAALVAAGGELSPSLPAELAAPVRELVTRALSIDPALRPSMGEWKRGLEEVIDGHGDGAFEDGPFPGLMAFDEQRARFFFGREAEVDEMLERLRQVPCLPIVGPSGVGKSSFLHAGVVPRLCAREPWLILAVRPGADPVGALARELVRAGAPRAMLGRPEVLQREAARALRADLLQTPALLASRLATLAALHSARVLLAVDQLEEVFTHGASDHEREQFLAMVTGAVDHPGDPLRVVFTVRDDFVGKLAVRELYVLRPLGLEGLRRTVLEPLRRCRYQLDDPTVVDELIREVGAASVADLPLLQFACRTLWDGRDRPARKLLRETYTKMGGVVGALARHAEHAVAALGPDDARTARRLFLQLVSGTTRRAVPRERLLELLGASVEPLLDRLLAARLLVQRTQDEQEGTLVEIAHESLLRSWDQLARWLEESRDERRFLDELDEAATVWERRRQPADTYDHNQLVSARQRARDLGVELSARLQTFLAAGDARVRAVRRARRARYLAAIVVLLVTSIPLLSAGARFLARERLIRTNAGTVDLELAAYDWIGGAALPVAMSELPALTLQLYAPKENDLDSPGPPLPEELVTVVERADGDGAQRMVRVTAPGGVMFLRVDGRGRHGERCAPSWIRLQTFPGYRGGRRAPRWHLDVPTCQASAADMVPIEEGQFIYGGPGEPREWRFDGDSDYTLPRQVVRLPAYSIDRTEVSNARFAPFGRMERQTGYQAPLYSNDELHRLDAEPVSPVTEINAYTARAFCRYLGKDLPSDQQWVKAARGGLTVRGVPNPHAERLYPWGVVLRRECVNVLEQPEVGSTDGYGWVAPVEEFACGASPYGVLNLGGNVQEWIAREGQPDPDNKQNVMRGGGPDSPFDLAHFSTVFVNHRSPRNFDYSIGVRCVDRTVWAGGAGAPKAPARAATSASPPASARLP